MSTQGLESSRWPKTDARYWRSRLFKRSGPDWHVRIGFKGRQERFPLRTPNAAAAGAKAREIYLALQSGGWDATLQKFKPWRLEECDHSRPITVGTFIEHVRTVAPIKPASFLTYERKFRFLVSEIEAIRSTRAKHDYVRGGHRKFRGDVDAVALARITPAAVLRWRVAYLQKRGKDPVALNRARHSAASIIRNSKALFSARFLKSLALTLPTPLPFEGVAIGKLPRTRYRSRVNLPVLMLQANQELREREPELFKIFLLAVCAGLRRSEIDSLTWKQFDWAGSRLRIETTEYGSLKTESSAEEIDLGPEFLKLFKASFRESHDGFVVSSAVGPRPAAHWKHYRCEGHFRRLIAWLRTKGIQDRKALHVLRKEFGSAVNAQFGIFAASAALRHSSITLTREYYVDRKERIALDIADLMKGEAA